MMKKFSKKGIVLLPVILGIVFVLLLGGVGMEIVKTNQKISKAFSEVEEFKKEGRNEEAVAKLKSLEDNFLVRYFGFKREEIDKKINEILSQEVKEEEAEEIKEKEAPITTEEKKEEMEVFDCKENLFCLIEMAKNCQRAKTKSTISLRFDIYVIKGSFTGQIYKEKDGNCVFKARAEKIIDVKKEGVTNKDAMERLKKEVEGKEITCVFKNEDLVNWLREASQGKLPSFDRSHCKY